MVSIKMLKLYLNLFVLTALADLLNGYKKYVFEVTTQYTSPDCVERPTVLINGKFPGPLIDVTPGELLEVEVRNLLASDSITIHFHGQLQKDSVWQDGVGMISNCPIIPKTTFTYRFTVNQEPGTYVYHGHIGGIRSAGLYGMLIISSPTIQRSPYYDEERTLLLSDWYHGSHHDIVTGLLDEKFRWPGDPQSILINGKGYYNCTSNNVPVNKNFPYYTPTTTTYCTASQCPGNEIIEVPKGKIIKLRIGSVAELSFMNIAIQDHNMTIIEADGKPVVPIHVQSLDINSGQRYSVLIHTSQNVNSYRISVKTRHRSGVVTGHAILKYNGSSNAVSDSQSVLATQPKWDDSTFTFEQQISLKGQTDAPPHDRVKRRIILLGTQERFLWKYGETANNHSSRRPEDNCNATNRHLRWAVNGVSYQWENTPVTHMVYYGIRQETMTEKRGYYRFSIGDVVDIVIQNYPACNQVCEQHPWHLHGHKFWVIGTGKGVWNGNASQMAQLNIKNAVYRDTTTVIPDSEKPFGGMASQGGCGWTVIRFVADNPGVWPFHCHVTWHFVMGMQAIFLVSADKIPSPADDIPICGDVTPTLWMNRKVSQKTVSSDDVISLWIPLIVGWCFSLGLIILLIFYCHKDRKESSGSHVQINLEAFKT